MYIVEIISGTTTFATATAPTEKEALKLSEKLYTAVFDNNPEHRKTLATCIYPINNTTPEDD